MSSVFRRAILTLQLILLYASPPILATHEQITQGLHHEIHKGDRSVLSSSEVTQVESTESGVVEAVDHEWLITDEVLLELDYDLQSVLDRTESGDVVILDVNSAVQFTKTLVIQQNSLTLMSKEAQTGTKVQLTCPEFGPLIEVKSQNFKISGFEITGCVKSMDAQSIVILDKATSCEVDNIIVQGNEIRVFFVSRDGRLSVKDSSFLDNKIKGAYKRRGSIGKGSVVRAEEPKLIEFKSCSVKNNAATTGGALSVSTGTINVEDSQFENNKAMATIGGAIHAYDHSKLFISDSNFIGNAAGKGGALYLRDNVNANITGSRFDENSAKETGGGLFVHDTCELLVSDTSFSKNTGDKGGATYIGFKSKGSISNSFYSNNTGITRGAGISLFRLSQLSISSTKFSGNTGLNGGAIYVITRSKASVSDSSFLENNATIDGGAVYTTDSSELSISNSFFHKNNASHGGAILVGDFSKGDVVLSNFTNNTSYRQGGVGKVDLNSTLSFKNSIFQGSISRFGGVLMAEHNSNISVKGGRFEHNKGHANGGAINLWSGSHADIQDSTFIATTAPYGGVIYSEKNSSLFVTGSIFKQGIAKFGAGVFVQVYSSANITKSLFEGNIATRYGGAAYVIKSSNLTVSLSNFTKNEQTYEGLFRSALTSSAKFTNCSIDGAPPSSSPDEDENNVENGMWHCPYTP
eukprot:g3782.t1